ncbi:MULTISPECIES: AMP-binding protein [Psychrobacter]|uniref:AMP-binding protein n=1 Tax=Psychrobacter TaxID=497 RepID=UPI000EF0F22A|nr:MULTISPECIES: AMP-binding protein [Psychrobacter]HCT73879.1 peptide synthetase [Psychrobacter sp.]
MKNVSDDHLEGVCTPNYTPNQDAAFANVVLHDYLDAIRTNVLVTPPNKTALIFADQSISYHEVGHHVAVIMAIFRQQGIRAGSVVAICLHKSPEHIYITIACALMGIVWLPIDIQAPRSRIDYLLTNSRADFVVSQGPLSPLSGIQITTINIDTARGHNDLIDPLDWSCTYDLSRRPAYYLYTSGSTGKPKCVVLNNQATANVLQQTIAHWDITHNDVFMAITPFHHDMSVFDIFAPLSVGATLVIPTTEQQKDAGAWATLIAKHHITLWCSVPAIVDMLLTASGHDQIKTLRFIAQGGDYINPSMVALLKQTLPQARLFSLGGPTETTIWSIWHEILDDDQHIIPYGKALAHNQYHILNEQHAPCEAGTIGTMYMSGINLSNGYLLDGETHHNDFVPIETINGGVVMAFKMSDLGYYRDDGAIIFSGRKAGYLKVKGVRIAASEVENSLSSHPAIHHAVVISCTNPTTDINELVALYTIDNIDNTHDISNTNRVSKQQLGAVDLRVYLKDQLPSSHIPSKFLLIDDIPLTANHKVDRNKLLSLAQERLSIAPTSVIMPVTAGIPTDPSLSAEVIDTILTLFKSHLPEHQTQMLRGDTQLFALNLKPKQLMTIATQLSQQLNVSLDFYSLVACKTLGEVMTKVQLALDRP